MSEGDNWTAIALEQFELVLDEEKPYEFSCRTLEPKLFLSHSEDPLVDPCEPHRHTLGRLLQFAV